MAYGSRTLTPGRGHGRSTDEPTKEREQVSAGGGSPERRPLTGLDGNKAKKKQKAHITVASLNVSGRGSLAQHGGNNKWNEINFLVKDRKIAILAVQEAHLDDTTVDNIHQLYGRRLKILHSKNPATNNADGVAMVINRDLIDEKKVTHEIIIPGRAMMATLPWKDDGTITILNVYAPNAPRKNENFWCSLRTRWKQEKRPPPDVLMGDFNLVECERDRSPMKSDDPSAVRALGALLTDWKVIDGWRARMPDQYAFSFPALPGMRAQSRLDRIYVRNEWMDSSEGWAIEQTHVHTDHKLVSAQLVHPHAPFIGKGRWTMNLNLLREDKIMNRIISEGERLADALANLQEPRVEHRNPQTLYRKFKETVTKILRDASKKELPKILQRIKKLDENAATLMTETQQDEGAGEDVENKRRTVGLIHERIAALEDARFQWSKDRVAARVILESETNSKFWNRLNKEKRPRDIMYALEKLAPTAGEDIYERRSDKMAEIAKTYHDTIQDIAPVASQEQTEEATEAVLQKVDAAANKKLRAQMKAPIGWTDVQTALNTSAFGKAAGLDGLPYELWRNLDERTRSERDSKEERMNPFKILAAVYTDIQDHGLIAGSNFAEGWMCPIYKQKGDRRKIANHRPITLLNSDYKLLTKVIATRMALIAQNVVHANQAGFIPGRSIMDQVRLTELMINFAEASEEEGLIVALDQEKAYDKIDHQYLWKVLRKFRVPEETIRLIQSLYDQAYTVVAINGEMSKPFKVRRGVRQGDPMSCILFDLAIEPLACALRKSDLEGYQIPGVAEKLIVTLFADDTTVYLSASDSYDKLLEILNRWCMASKAKFNEDKTQFIPIGPKTYRDRVIATRKMSPVQNQLPAGTLILKDNHHVRILGAFLGNDTDMDDIWKPVIKKTVNAVDRWKRSHPSLTGKTIITQMTVGGITQYLTAAHGMPSHLEKELISVIRDFIWDGRRPKVAMDVLCAPKSQGGIGLLDIKSRNEAIETMLLKTYLNMSSTRPLWAFVADSLLARFAAKSSGIVSQEAAVNPILQYWTVNPNSKGLPRLLGRLMRAARKENLSVNVAKPGRSLRRQMPAWFHVGATTSARKLQNKPAAKCLRSKHNVRSVADLLRSSMRIRRPYREPGHLNANNCQCAACKNDRLSLGCKTPASCSKIAADLLQALHPKWKLTEYFTKDDLSLTPGRKLKNAANLNGEGSGCVTFDPSLSCSDLNLTFRIHSTKVFNTPATRIPAPFNIQEEARTVTIAVWSQDYKKKTDPKFAMAIFQHQGSPLNKALKLPEFVITPMQAYLAAISDCAATTPPFAPLSIRVQDSTVVETLCNKLHVIEQCGWTDGTNKELLQAAVSALRKRSAKTEFLLPQEGTIEHDYLPALLLARVALLAQETWEPPVTHPEFILDGAQLSTMTQALAYHLTRINRRPPKMAKSTNLRILRIQEALEPCPEPQAIWDALRDRAFTKPVSTFLWKTVHNAVSVGKYWDNIPGREHLRDCPGCKVEESMEHILCDCEIPGRKLAWTLTLRCLARKNINIEAPTLPRIMACGLAEPPRTGQTGPGSTRLLKIMISETAFLIWKIRCERRMQRGDEEADWHTLAEIENKWKTTMNTRLRRDKLMTDPRFGRKALKKCTVLSTWSGTLENEHLLDDDWILNPRVLVGISPPNRLTGGRVRADPAG